MVFGNGLMPGSQDQKSFFLMLAAMGGGAAGLLYWASRRKQDASPGKEATGFEAYLRRHIDNPSLTNKANHSQVPIKTSFEAYLRNTDLHTEVDPSGTRTDQGTKDLDTVGPPPPSSIPVTVMFGTEFGFSREIAEVMCEKLVTPRDNATDQYWPELVDMAELGGTGYYSQAVSQVLLIVCSTQGDGVPPTEAREYYDWLMSSAAAEKIQWQKINYSVCALGDTSYTHFCQCGRDIDARLEALGAHRFAPRMDVNKEDWKAINQWMDAALCTLPTLALQPAKDLLPMSHPKVADGLDGISPLDTGKKKKWSKSRPFYGTIVDVESLCTNVNDSVNDKNTVRIEIDISSSDDTDSMHYEPGDALGVWPLNDPQAVEEILCQLTVDGSYSVPSPRWHYVEQGKSETDGKITLREALSRCYDLRTPKRGLLDKVFNNVKDRHGCRTMVEYLQARNFTLATTTSTKLFESDEDVEAGYLAERHVIDVLKDFQASLSPEELLACLRQLAPRLYSISSSPLEKPGHVQITVAVVRYNALECDRIGVASTYLGERVGIGSQVPVYVYPNPDFRLPSDDNKPLIMVGPGTGIAPFRAFIQHRLLCGKQSTSEMVLYFGCRRQDQDYLYGATLEGWAADGHITLYTAFSRQQKLKVYVQNRLQESSELVWRLLEEGGHFYICGDGARMASDVETALKAIVAQHGGLTRDEDVEAYVQGLEASGRLQRDVWIS